MVSDIEQALNNGIAPWKEIEYRCNDFWVFADGFPVSTGHLLFVPVMKTPSCLYKCFEAAYKWGCDGVEDGKWSGFNIGQNVGEVAGQTVNYPHVHMIPRRLNDTEDPRGGIRNCIPTKGNYYTTRKVE